MNLSDFTINELRTIVYGLLSEYSEHVVGKNLDTKLLNDKEYAKLVDLFCLEISNRDKDNDQAKDRKMDDLK